MSSPESLPSVEEARSLVCELCRHFYSQGWVSGTGGGISVLSSGGACIAPSGVQKERMLPHEIFVMSLSSGVPLAMPDATAGLRISQCTPLFQVVYRLRSAGAVIHSHAISSVLASQFLAQDSVFRCTELEMIKGIFGHSYTDTLTVPIIENTAHECDLAGALEAINPQLLLYLISPSHPKWRQAAVLAHPRTFAVIVKNHGVYIWGTSWQQAKQHAEVYHYLFDLCLQMRLHSGLPKLS